MKTKIEMVVRILLGLILLVFGLNKFLQFMPMPETTPEAGALMGAFMAVGYMFPLIAITEIVVGALLLINKVKPLALVMLVPLVVNILLFHIFLDPAGIGAGALVAILHIALIVMNKEKLMFLIKE